MHQPVLPKMFLVHRGRRGNIRICRNTAKHCNTDIMYMAGKSQITQLHSKLEAHDFSLPSWPFSYLRQLISNICNKH